MFEKRYLVVESDAENAASTQLSEWDLPGEVRRMIKDSKRRIKVFEDVSNQFPKEEADGGVPQEQRREEDAN